MGNIWRRYPRRGLRRLPALEGLLLAPGVRVDPSDFARLSSAFLDEAGPCAFFRAVPLGRRSAPPSLEPALEPASRAGASPSASSSARNRPPVIGVASTKSTRRRAPRRDRETTRL